MAVEDIMQDIQSKGRSATTKDMDTLDSIIDWINGGVTWSEENVIPWLFVVSVMQHTFKRCLVADL